MRSWVAATLGAVLACAAGSAAAQTHWDVPTPLADGSLHTRNIVEFAKNVGERTGGSLQLTIHDNESLIKLGDIANAVSRRAVPAGELPGATLVDEVPLLGAATVPFLASGFDAAWRLYQAQKPPLQEELGKRGLAMLYSVASAPVGLFADRMVKTFGDFAGMRLRADTPALQRLAQLLGAVAVALPPEVDSVAAMKDDRIDGFFASAPAGASRRAWTAAAYFHDFQAWLPRDLVIANKDAVANLSASERRVLDEAATAAEGRGWDWSKAAAREANELLGRNGIVVVTPDQTLATALAAIGQILAGEWARAAGPAAAKLVAAAGRT
ncbi:MAG TPA: TRAP transporter substrate-binding protein DctP [Hyphomicrobiales bacterium]|nr:TRAP transporter substrate-binding protein DctP [Hyphomicrobiales bacterium]